MLEPVDLAKMPHSPLFVGIAILPEVAMAQMPRHRCLIYAGSPANQLASLARVIREKLGANFRCLYFNTAPMVAGMRSYLAAAGVDVGDAINRGSIVLSSDQRHLRDDEFVPELMLAMLSDAVDAATSDGFAGLWASGDMTWEFGPKRDFSKLIEYEFGLEEIFRKWPALCGVCQYHADTLPPHVLQQGLVSHRSRFVNATLSQMNPYYMPTPTLAAKHSETQPVRAWVEYLTG